MNCLIANDTKQHLTLWHNLLLHRTEARCLRLAASVPLYHNLTTVESVEVTAFLEEVRRAVRMRRDSR